MAGSTVYRTGIDILVKDQLKGALRSWATGLTAVDRQVLKLQGQLHKLDATAMKGFTAELQTMKQITAALVLVNKHKTDGVKTESQTLKLEGQRAVQAERLAREQMKTAREQARADKDHDAAQRRQQTNAERIERIKRETLDIESRTAREESRRMAASYSALERQQRLQDRINAQNARNARNNPAPAAPGPRQWNDPSGAMSQAGQYGSSIIHGLQHSVQSAAKIDAQRTMFRQMGLSEGDNQQAFSFARNLTNTRGISEHDSMEAMMDVQNVTKDLHHTMELAPLFTKFLVAQKTLYHISDKQAMDTIKAAEMMGHGKGDEFLKSVMANLQLFSKISSATMNRVTGADFLNFSKTSGMARFSLNDDAKVKLAAIIQEQGGSRTGTALMSLFQNLAFGRATQKSTQALMDAHLINPASVIRAKNGSVKGFKAGGLVDGDQLMVDPMKWMDKHLSKYIKTMGVVKGTAFLSQFMSNRTAANLVTTYLMQEDNIKKEQTSVARSKNIDQSFDNAMGGFQGGLVAFHASLENFEVRVGEVLLPKISVFINRLTDAFMKLNAFVDKHPKIAKAAVMSTAAVGGAGMLAGWAAPLVSTIVGLRNASAIASIAGGMSTAATAIPIPLMGATGVAGAGGGAAAMGGVGAAGAAAVALPVVLAVLATAAKVGLVIAAWKTNFLGFRTTGLRVWGDIQKVGQIVGGVLSGVGHMVHGIWTYAFTAAKEALAAVADYVLGPLQAAFQGLINWGAGTWFGKLIGGGVGFVEGLLGSMAGGAQDIATFWQKFDQGATQHSADHYSRSQQNGWSVSLPKAPGPAVHVKVGDIKVNGGGTVGTQVGKVIDAHPLPIGNRRPSQTTAPHP